MKPVMQREVIKCAAWGVLTTSLLGAMKQNFGHYGPCFIALSLFAVGCWAVCRAVAGRVSNKPQPPIAVISFIACCALTKL